MHFTYTVPRGPLLGQRETTSERIIGFMKWVSRPIVRETLHNNGVAFLKPILCLSTFNLRSIRKNTLMSSTPTTTITKMLQLFIWKHQNAPPVVHFEKTYVKLLKQFHGGTEKVLNQLKSTLGTRLAIPALQQRWAGRRAAATPQNYIAHTGFHAPGTTLLLKVGKWL